MLEKNNFYFLPSNQVKVFPCAYRNANFDLESKLNTESNLGSLPGQHLLDSYIVNWEKDDDTNSGILSIILKGYSFKIKLIEDDIRKLKDADVGTVWYVKLKLKDIVLNSASENSFSTQKTLDTFISSTRVVDGSDGTVEKDDVETIELDFRENQVDYFCGLTFGKYSTVPPILGTNEYALDCFTVINGANSNKDIEVRYKSKFPQVYSGKNEGSVLIGNDSLVDNKVHQTIIGESNNTKTNNYSYIINTDENTQEKTISIVESPDTDLPEGSFIIGSGKNSRENILECYSIHSTTSNGNNKKLHVLGDSLIDGNIYNKESVYVGGSLNIAEKTNAFGNVYIKGDSSLDSSLTVKGITSLNGNLAVPLAKGKSINLFNNPTNNENDFISLIDDTPSENTDIDKSQIKLNIFSNTINYTNSSISTVGITLNKDVLINNNNKTITIIGDNFKIQNGDNFIIQNKASTPTTFLSISNNESTINIQSQKDITLSTDKLVFNDFAFTSSTDSNTNDKLLIIDNNTTSDGITIKAKNFIADNIIKTKGISMSKSVKTSTLDKTYTLDITPENIVLTNSTNYIIPSHGSNTVTIRPSGPNTVTISPTRIAFSGGAASSITAGSFYAISDRRLKENIEDYTPSGNILDLPIKTFNFKNSKKKQIGCIAQDLQKICPEIVEENSDGYLSIQENKLVYLLLAEVKKLKVEINKLKGGE